MSDLSGNNTIKKIAIIIASVIGAITSTVGVIAIFFPDYLNMEKEDIDKFTIQIGSVGDSNIIYDFFEKNTKKIVYLDISICAMEECEAIEIDNDSLSFRIDENESCTAEKDVGYGGIIFYFGYNPEENQNPQKNVWDWYKFEDCKNNPEKFGVLRVSGYYIVPEGPGSGQGWLEWLLSPVDEKDILLKKY